MPKDREQIAPETHNSEQEDESTQAQSVAEEALGRASSGIGAEPTEKVKSGNEGDNVQDLVDHMKQMETSGRIDMSAFAGERNDDDEEGSFGTAAKEE